MALTKRERRNLENALEQIALSEKAAAALRYSYQRAPEIKEDKDFDEADWERWDALAVRFARLSDILTQRVFRAIDVVEFMPPRSTFIDRINRAEKRGHISSAFEWKEIREIRNQIVHEYANEHVLPLLQDMVQYAPELLNCVDRLADYKQEIVKKIEGSPGE
jgi:hypothetical protein